ncbi:sulfurtransferase [Pokkaliibacter plantistimulans]|uniref:Thiosulfate sulfurtransferase GlpE n=1 Tax=Pokkaliibacter plantistimulans TaxID=1635171 RepID=A0ABX5LTH4_9GAMM|nr:thiosulfate sulfurtransferase GlpE [Pokkaliibacter plantistimulans]PXF29949.1 sulfurtransferase [Pokkaliibacter plantistimulans]
MNNFTRISPSQAKDMIGNGAQVADIRDPVSYSNGHIPGASALSNENLQHFLESADPDHPLIVVCYHGHSSQSAASFLANHGFEQVYSMDGGFEEWRTLFPADIATGNS